MGMLYADGLVFFLLLGFWLVALFDAITADEAAVRNLGKGFWIVIILFTIEIGAVLWFVAGRPQTPRRPGGLPYKGNTGASGGTLSSPSPRRSRGGPVAPDDDPAFLRSLREGTAEHEQILGSWEADLRRREEEMRRREGGEGAEGSAPA